MPSSQVRNEDTSGSYEASERPDLVPRSPSAAAAERWHRPADTYPAPPYRPADRQMPPARTAADPRSRARVASHPARSTRPPGGLTATGGGAIAVVAVSGAAIIDAAMSPSLGRFFDIAFLISAVVVAGRISWRDSWAAMMLPPLVFVAAAGIASQFSPVSAGGWLDRTSADMLAAVVHGWLPLFVGVALAGAIIVRRRSMR